MSEHIRVVNTAPLIFLTKLGRLELVRLGCDTVYVPPTVLRELRAVPDQATASVKKQVSISRRAFAGTPEANVFLW